MLTFFNLVVTSLRAPQQRILCATYARTQLLDVTLKLVYNRILRTEYRLMKQLCVDNRVVF